jgi:hypothetical protein
MAKYRKKPVVIEAEIYKKGMEDGIGNKEVFNSPYISPFYEQRPYINTLEGIMYITEGDYIITGVKGERYPCKPDIFEQTYEKVED